MIKVELPQLSSVAFHTASPLIGGLSRFCMLQAVTPPNMPTIQSATTTAMPTAAAVAAAAVTAKITAMEIANQASCLSVSELSLVSSGCVCHEIFIITPTETVLVKIGSLSLCVFLSRSYRLNNH